MQHGFQLTLIPRHKTIAYLRVSTAEQDIEKNKFDILHLANEKGLGCVEWIEETASVRVSWRRRNLASILEQIQRGLFFGQLGQFHERDLQDQIAPGQLPAAADCRDFHLECRLSAKALDAMRAAGVPIDEEHLRHTFLLG